MVKISQYQSSTLQSSAVGIPQSDETGQIYAKGVSDLVGGAAQIRGIFVEREEKANQLAAMAKFGDYSMAYAEAKGKAAILFRDKPKEYASHVKSKAQELATAFSQDMEPGAAEQFTKMTTNIIAADSDNLVNWGIKREQEIILGNIDKSFNSEELNAEAIATPEALQGALARTEIIGKTARNFVDESTAMKKVETTKTAVKKTAITGMMMRDAEGTYGLLARGKFKGILTPTEEKTALTQAHELMVNQTVLAQYRNLATASVEISELSDKVANGTASVADISRRLEWAELNKNKKDANGELIVTPNYIRGLEAVRNLALGLDPRTATDKRITSVAFKADFERRWDVFLSGRKGKPRASDYDDVIGLYADLVEAKHSNIIDDARFETMKKLLDTKLSSTLLKGDISSSLSESLANAGNYKFWNNPHDIFSEGYTLIRDTVNKRADLSPAEKQEFIEKAVVSYTEKVQSMDPNQIEKAEKRRFAMDTINGNEDKKIPGLLKQLSVYKHPDTGAPVKIGDRIDLRGIPGKKHLVVDWDDAKGQPVINLPKSVVKALENR